MLLVTEIFEEKKQFFFQADIIPLFINPIT